MSWFDPVPWIEGHFRANREAIAQGWFAFLLAFGIGGAFGFCAARWGYERRLDIKQESITNLQRQLDNERGREDLIARQLEAELEDVQKQRDDLEARLSAAANSGQTPGREAVPCAQLNNVSVTNLHGNVVNDENNTPLCANGVQATGVEGDVFHFGPPPTP